MSPQRIWVITGCSEGLGRELTLAALARGDKVVATARYTEKVTDLVELYPDHCHAIQLDITDSFESLVEKAKRCVDVWGKIDVLVNNAGRGLVGLVEESGADGFMEMYKTNVFGTLNVTNAFLPHMRERRNGTIVFIGSRSGWRTRFPANGLYGSSKAAIHAIADTLSIELEPLNIKTLNVVPGGLRTANIDHVFFVPDKALAHPTPNIPVGEVPEYALIRSRVHDYLKNTNGTQSGDPRKAALVIVDVVRNEGVAEGKPWTHTLVLGSDALRDIAVRCEETLQLLEDWGDVAKGIDL